MLVATKIKNSDGKSFFESDLHVNLWKDFNEQYSLDLGVMLYDIDCTNGKELDSICIFLPYICEKSSLVDLGCKLKTSEAVSTIFNDFYKMESGPGKSSMDKFFIDEGNAFYVFELGENNIKVENNEQSLNGTFVTLSIPIPDELRQTKFNLYIRLRCNICSPEGRKFLKHDEQISNNFLQAAFSRMELYDFRLNDIRNTDDKVFQELTSKNCFKLVEMRKVHFFFMTGAKDHVVNGNTDRMDTRMLEIDKWAEYRGKTFEHALVAYHWKKKKEKEDPENIKSFEVFFRNTCNNVNWLLVVSYLCFLVAIGTTGSLLSTLQFSLSINWTAIIGNIIVYLAFGVFYNLGKCK